MYSSAPTPKLLKHLPSSRRPRTRGLAGLPLRPLISARPKLVRLGGLLEGLNGAVVFRWGSDCMVESISKRKSTHILRDHRCAERRITCILA